MDRAMKKIVFKTVSRRNRINISSAEEFLNLASVSFQKRTVPKKTDRERHDDEIFIDTLEDIGFFFRLQCRLVRDGASEEEIGLVSRKVDLLLEHMEEDLENHRERLYDALNSDNETVLTAVVFILSSVEVNREISPCLNKVLSEFSKCNEQRLPCFVNGLKHGRHPRLLDGLELLKLSGNQKTKEAKLHSIRNFL